MNIYRIELGHIMPGTKIFSNKNIKFVNLAKKEKYFGQANYRICLSVTKPPCIIDGDEMRIEEGALSHSEKGKRVIRALDAEFYYKIIIVEYRNLKIKTGRIVKIYVGDANRFWAIKLYPGASFEAWNHTKADGRRDSKVFKYDSFE